MNSFARFTEGLLIFVAGTAWMACPAGRQEAKVIYLSPAESVQKRGGAPSMKVKLISSGEGLKQYAVIFSAGDEAYSGLLDFAEKYHVTSGHLTAIGALSSVVLAWFDPKKKMYRENPIQEQVEVATMTGDFALYRGKPVLHAHIVVGRRDGTANGGHVIQAIVQPTLDDLDPRIEALVNDLIGRVADKWTMLILEVSAEKGELRFTRLSELVEGVSQKMLTQTLRHMERDGLLTRTVHPVVPPPPGVETPLFRGEFAEEMEGQKGMDVEVLAKKAIAGIEAGKLEIRPGLSNVLKIMSRIAPNSCSTKWRRWRSPRK
jgi:uncharacterized protein